MKSLMKMLETKFVKYIPDEIKEDVLYISYEFNTAIHLCACGCKNKVERFLGKLLA